MLSSRYIPFLRWDEIASPEEHSSHSCRYLQSLFSNTPAPASTPACNYTGQTRAITPMVPETFKQNCVTSAEFNIWLVQCHTYGFVWVFFCFSWYMEAPESHTWYYSWESFAHPHFGSSVWKAYLKRCFPCCWSYLPCQEKMQLFQMKIYCLLLRTDNEEDYN